MFWRQTPVQQMGWEKMADYRRNSVIWANSVSRSIASHAKRGDFPPPQRAPRPRVLLFFPDTFVMMKRLGLMILVSACLVLGACGSDSSTADTAATVPTAIDSPTDVLKARLIRNVPEGYKQEREGYDETGPFDLEQAIRDDGGDDAREVLTNGGFVAGYRLMWSKDASWLVNRLYRFSKPQGAREYVARMVANFSGLNPEATETEFTVAGVPGARGVHYHFDDIESVVVVFARGGYFGQIAMNGTDATTRAVSRMAAEVYDNLAGHAQATSSRSLSALLLRDGPPRFARQPDVPGEVGPVDEETLSESDNPKVERAMLRETGFVAGHSRYWLNDVSETEYTKLYVILTLHRSAEGAEAFRDHMLDTTGDSEPDDDCSIDDIPNAMCKYYFNDVGEEGGMVVFTRGPVVAAITMHGRLASMNTMKDLATEQYRRLTA